jgi:hypothetical protein
MAEHLARSLETLIANVQRRFQEELTDEVVDDLIVRCDELCVLFNRLAGLPGWEIECFVLCKKFWTYFRDGRSKLDPQSQFL